MISRDKMIAALSEDDANGCYSDEDNIAEGMRPLTDAELWRLYLELQILTKANSDCY